MQSSPATVSEVHEALTKRSNLNVSRKTVERDLMEMLERKLVIANGLMPQRFEIIKHSDVELTFTKNEIEFLLSVIPSHLPVYHKIKNASEV